MGDCTTLMRFVLTSRPMNIVSDTNSYFDLWAAAIAINVICIRWGLLGASRNFGKWKQSI